MIKVERRGKLLKLFLAPSPLRNFSAPYPSLGSSNFLFIVLYVNTNKITLSVLAEKLDIFGEFFKRFRVLNSTFLGSLKESFH